MRSLFVKIFVWFWLAMALVVLASTLSSMMAFNEGPKHLGGQLAMFGLTATERLAKSGKAGVDEYLNLLEQTTRTRAYLFDENANLIAGREPPAKINEVAQALVNEGRDKVSQTSRTDFVARKFTGDDGKTFIIAGEFPRPPAMMLPFRPHAWWLQSIAVVLTAGLFCYGLAKYLSSPIVKLRAATQQLAHGDLSARVGAANGKRRDELADLGRDFDDMAERLQSLVDSQKRLLHDISHELRSPLTRLKIALELARKGESPNDRWALERIEREADRLNDLIGQLLTLARMDSDLPNRSETSIDLQNLVDEIVADADFEARSNGRAVKLVSSLHCPVMGNEQLLRSAIENVVRNAISYTDEGTTVEVSLSRKCGVENGDDLASITVLDQGSGVPQAALANIFHPFYRVADARDRQSGGSGLGLSITRRAVEIHGGSVTAANIAGGGLSVEIVLPLSSNSNRSDLKAQPSFDKKIG
jgi:two-component system, OmpR family, sensor histidine kinase CpxA